MRSSGGRTYRLKINVTPKTKQAVRFTKKGAYQPKSVTEFEEAVKEAWSRSGHPTLTEPCKVKIRLRRNSFTVHITPIRKAVKATVRGDVDNYAKAILDGLQGEGGAFMNDRQVYELTMIKHEEQ